MPAEGWHDKPSVFIAHVEPEGFALALAEGGAAFPDGFDIRGTDEQALGDEGERRDF